MYTSAKLPRLLHAKSTGRSMHAARWGEARAKSGGYDTPVIAERALASALAVKRGEAAYERDTVLFAEPSYRWQLLACIASVAAAKSGRIHVLDVGGSLASVYLQHRQFLNLFPDLLWSVVEQPHLVEAGRSHLEEERLRFFDDIENVEQFRSIDIALFLSSLQYMVDPFDTLRCVAQTKASHLVIDRIPLSKKEDDELVIQHVPAEIYPASYPQWQLSQEKLLCFIRDEIRFREIARYVDGIDGDDHIGFLFQRI